jgi:hypothetical protein
MIIKVENSDGYTILVNMENVTYIQEHSMAVKIMFTNGSIIRCTNPIKEISDQLCQKTT